MSLEYFRKGDGIEVTNGLIRKTTTGWGNGLVLLDVGVTSGVYRWKFLAVEGKKATIGICDLTVSMDTYVNQSDKGWGYYQANGKIGTSGPAKIPFGEPFKHPGDVVEMEFDADRGLLRFWRNSELMGVAFKNIPVDGKRRFCAAVSLYKENAAIRIVSRPFDSRGPSRNVASNSKKPSPAKKAAPATPPVSGKKGKQVPAAAASPMSPSPSKGEEAQVIRVLRHPSAVSVVSADEFPGHPLARKLVKGWDDGLVVFGPVFDPRVDDQRVWSFKVIKGVKITIGMVLSDTTRGYVNKTEAGWGYYMANGKVGHSGPAKRLYGPPYVANDIVTVEAVSIAGAVSLRFYLNGVALGEAYKIPHQPLLAAAVSLYAADDCVIGLKTAKQLRLRDLPPLPSKDGPNEPASGKNTPKKPRSSGKSEDLGAAITPGAGVARRRSVERPTPDSANISVSSSGSRPSPLPIPARYQEKLSPKSSPKASNVKSAAGTPPAAAAKGPPGMERTHSHSKAPPNPAAGEAAAGADRGSVAGAKTPAAGTGAAEAVPASAPAPAATSTPSKKSSEKSSKLGKPKLSKAEVLRTAWGVTVSGRTLTKHQKGWDDGLVLLGPVVHSGRHSWTFRILKGQKCTVGICTTSVPDAGYVNKSKHGWGYYQANGKIGHAGPANVRYGEDFRSAGDTVEVQLDCDNRTLSFTRNGQNQGCAFTELPVNTDYVGAVSLYDALDSMKVLGYARLDGKRRSGATSTGDEAVDNSDYMGGWSSGGGAGKHGRGGANIAPDKITGSAIYGFLQNALQGHDPLMVMRICKDLLLDGFDSPRALSYVEKTDAVIEKLTPAVGEALWSALEALRQAHNPAHWSTYRTNARITAAYSTDLEVMELQIKKADGSTIIMDAVNSDTAAQLKRRLAIMDLASSSSDTSSNPSAAAAQAVAAAASGGSDGGAGKARVARQNSSVGAMQAADMVLIFSGRQLEDTDTLEEHAVQNNSTLQLLYI